MDRPPYPRHFKLKLQLYNTQPCLGKGVVTLLQLISEGHSLRSASQSMNMAYSKSWKIIRAAEEDLGFSLIIKQKGGAGHAGSVLTPEGEDLLKKYQEFESASRQAVGALFHQYFGKDD